MRIAVVVWLVGVIALTFAPLGLFLLQGSDFSAVASEPLAYTFFYSMRLFTGPDITAWLPHGHMVLSIQHAINAVLLPRMDGSAAGLRDTLNEFSYATMAAINLVFVIAFLMAARVRATWVDRFVVTAAAFAPIYCAFGAEVYTLWPAYYLMSIALTALAVAIFQQQWRADSSRPYLRAILAGCFVGVLISNKISTAPIGAVIVTAIVFDHARVRDLLLRGVLAVVGAAATFVFFFMGSGLFQLDWAAVAAGSWLRYISNPGSGDDSVLSTYLASGNSVMAAWWLVACILAVWSLLRDPSLRRATVMLAILFGSVACGYYIFKRPAGTTYRDSFAQLLAFGGMFIAMSSVRRANFAAVSALVAALCVAAWVENAGATIRFWAANSRRLADEQWAFFARTVAGAPSRCFYDVIPDNRYQYGDPFIVLLKGTADFGTWTVSASGQRVLDRFAPGLQFATLARSLPDNLDGCRIVWYDPAWLPKITEQEPGLARALAIAGVRVEAVPLPRVALSGYIAQTP